MPNTIGRKKNIKRTSKKCSKKQKKTSKIKKNKITKTINLKESSKKMKARFKVNNNL